MVNMSFFRKAFYLYFDGFKNMSSLGKKLWIIVIVKLFIMFAILKFVFFPNFLNSNFETEKDKSEYVINSLTNKN
ncbi:MAG: DUF4492 domain-containing protein [Marinilabiliales bacterium]|nr:MAG: DUF4492 domain-containing protein [Marinilabiliales bacterium]